MRKPAFTLIELLVAMAIIAVLIGLAIGGISIAQQVSRDNERRGKLQEISIALNAYYASNSQYPIAGASGATCLPTQVCRLTNGGISVGGRIISTNGPTAGVSSSTGTDANGTLYCYERSSGGYIVGAVLEDGSTYDDLSTDVGGTCSASNYL